MTKKRSKKLNQYTINRNYQDYGKDFTMDEAVQYNLACEQYTRESMLNELLDNVRRLAIINLCYLNTDAECFLFENARDNYDHLMMEEHMSQQKASGVVEVLWAVLGALKDELLEYQE